MIEAQMHDEHDESSHPDFRGQRPRDVVTQTPAEVRKERMNGHRSIGARMRSQKFSKRTEAYLDAMVHRGIGWREAATAAGINHKIARWLLSSPAFHRLMAQRAEQLRATENARNPAVAAKIRDRALKDDASAAQQKVALEAMKFLEGRESAAGSTTINNGPVINMIGYAIDLSGPSAGPVQIQPQAPPRFIDQEDDEFR